MVSPGQSGEDEDVVDAGGEQDDEDGYYELVTQRYHGVESGDDGRDDEEVRQGNSSEESHVGEGVSNRIEGDVEEGHEQECDEAGGDRSGGQR